MKCRLLFLTLSCFSLQSVTSQVNPPDTPPVSDIEQMNIYFNGNVQQFDENFQKFLKERQKEFEDFRRKQNEEFANFIEYGRWERLEKKAGVKPPKDNRDRPVVYDEKKEKKGHKSIPVRVISDKRPSQIPQPTPGPIRENEDEKIYNSFSFYGTNLKVRWGDLSLFKLNDISKKSLADGYRTLTSDKYNNLLSDCLALRKKYVLCDWAYYKMLGAMAASACGQDTNEATFLHGVLYQQSGYTMRFAVEKDGKETKRLHLLIKIKGIPLGKNPILVDGDIFYAFDSNIKNSLEGLVMNYKNEQDMQLEINELPHLEFKLTDMKTRSSKKFNMNIEMAVNENQIKFMNEYPTSYDGNDFMTRWAYYANTQASEEMRAIIYPQLRERLKGADELLAVNMLLNWVQTAFEYGYDTDIWKRDRAFFSDETLHYQFSDCEDRAILFSRLVRDIIGLDVALVYYSGNPAHLSAAVCFNKHVDGDRHELGDRVFVEADPCYINAKVGHIQPNYFNVEGKVFLLKR